MDSRIKYFPWHQENSLVDALNNSRHFHVSNGGVQLKKSGKNPLADFLFGPLPKGDIASVCSNRQERVCYLELKYPENIRLLRYYQEMAKICYSL